MHHFLHFGKVAHMKWVMIHQINWLKIHVKCSVQFSCLFKVKQNTKNRSNASENLYTYTIEWNALGSIRVSLPYIKQLKNKNHEQCNICSSTETDSGLLQSDISTNLQPLKMKELPTYETLITAHHTIQCQICKDLNIHHRISATSSTQFALRHALNHR